MSGLSILEPYSVPEEALSEVVTHATVSVAPGIGDR
jgi:hypothetical protein